MNKHREDKRFSSLRMLPEQASKLDFSIRIREQSPQSNQQLVNGTIIYNYYSVKRSRDLIMVHTSVSRPCDDTSRWRAIKENGVIVGPDLFRKLRDA